MEEGGEGGGGDVPGGEAEDFDDFAACIELGCSANWRAVCQKESAALRESGADGPFEDKSKKHEGVGCTSGSPGILSKKIRIPLFEHFTHQLVIVLIEELVTVCIRS